MANKEIHIPLKVDDQGSTKKKTEEARALREELEKASKVAENMGGGSETLRKAKKRSEPLGKQLDDYDKLRGVSNISGGTARDFSDQARGLGGLVRLYATFAANIYAVSAAFNALKEAANVDKMIRANELMSTRVGLNLNKLAKEIVNVTDATISFQDAVKFTNIGTAAGLGGKQIQELTVIAKGAASALGRDVGESIQRIIQGTAKQEQEILDELGIFIKAKQAYEDYAKARNTKVDDLSSQQKVIAYAEAVAKAGQKWKEFAAVEDPYAKLLATGKNALNELLKTANEVFIPIIKLINDSKDAIMSLTLLITGTLIKKALPQLKELTTSFFQFDKAKLKSDAEATKNIILAEYQDLTKKINNLREKQAQIRLSDFGDKATYTAMKLGAENIQSAKGVGVSSSRVSTSIFGSESKPIDTTKYKEVADIEAKILQATTAQLRDSTKKLELQGKLISSGMVEIDQETKKLALGAQGKAVAAAIYADIEKQNLLLAQQVKLQSEINTLENLRSGKMKQVEKIAGGIGPNTKNVTAQTMAGMNAQLAVNETVVKKATLSMGAYDKAANAVAASAIGATRAVAGWNAGLAVNATALQNTALAAEYGMLAMLKNLGTTLASIPGMFTAATVSGVGFFGKVGAAAGATVSIIGAVGSSLAKILSAAFGPLMIAWTIWELFGDKIMDFLKSDSAKLAEKNKKAWDEYASAVEHVTGTLEKNEKRIKEATTAGEVDAALKARINAYNSEIDAYKKYQEEITRIKKEEEAKREANDKSKTIGSKVTDVYSLSKESGSNADKAKELLRQKALLMAGISEENLNEAAKRSAQYALSIVEKDIDRLQKSAGKSGLVARDQLVLTGESIERTRNLLVSLIPEFENASQKTLGVGEKLMAAAKAAENLGDKMNKAKLDQKFGFKHQEVTAVALAFESLKKATIVGKNLVQVKDLFQQVVRAADESGNSLIKNAAAVRILREVMANSGSTTEDYAKALAELSKDGSSLLQVLGLMDKQLSKTSKEGAEFGKEAKASFRAIEQEIRKVETSAKALQASLEVRDRLSGISSAISGRIDAGDLEAQKDLISQEINAEKLKAILAEERVRLSTKTTAEEKANAIETLHYTLENLETTEKQKYLAAELNIIEKEAAEALRLQAMYSSDRLADINRLHSLRSSDLDLEKEFLSLRGQLGVLSVEDRKSQELTLDRQKLNLDYVKELAVLAEQKNAAEKAALERANAAKDAASKVGGDLGRKQTVQAQADLEESTRRITEEYDKQTSLQANLLANSLAKNDAQREFNELLGRQNKELSKVDKLSGIFDKIFEGTGLDKQSKSISKFFKDSSTSKQKLAKADKDEEIRKNAYYTKLGKLQAHQFSTTEEYTQAISDIRKQEDEASKEALMTRAQLEFDTAMQAIDLAKSVLDEKTAGYKLLNGIEKAMYTYRAVMQAKEMATYIADTAKYVSSALQRTFSNATEAVTNQGKGDPYTAFARIAAMIALMASITGKSQGGGSSIPTGVTAKDRQETQGTGMRWDPNTGKMVETGGGVLGDSKAKSESVKNSLEVIRDNSIEGISFDNRMLKVLESIDRAINETAVSLYKIPGIRTGSAFGTVEGTSKGLTGTASAIGNTFKAFTGMLVTSRVFDSIVGSIFGKKKVDQEILDSGVKLAGSFADLAKGGQGLINFYETLKTTTTKSSLFGLSKSTSTSIETNTKGAPPEITQAVSSIFSYAAGLFKDVGSRIGKTAEEIDTQLSSINFDQLLSLRDLKGEDLEKEFNAVISSMLDSTADALFSEMKRFQKFGEGMLETVVRVVDANRKLNEGLNAIGQSSALKSVGNTLDYDITEKLLEAVGGLEAFTGQIQFFRDEFLTESERIAPVAKAVRDEMERLGYSMVDTRAEFKSLVQSLDLTVPAQQELYASLMLVAKSFAEVYEETEKLLDAEEYRNKVIGLEISGLKALGLTTMAVAAEREAELAELNKLAPAQRDQLVYYQKVLYAIEDAMEVRNAEIEVLGALGFTYDQLILQREVEMMGMTDQLRAVKKWQNAVEDYNASQDLMIELLGKVGDGTKATAIIRERELKGLNATDKAIKRAIYALEDEAAIRDKLKEIREEETSTLKDNISATRDYIKSLKDYRSSLLTGNLSPLNPLQKYEQTKSEVMALAAKASAPAVTEEDKRAQKEARDKLQSSTNAWLEASRVLFASSTAYTSDFNTVLSIVDKAIASAEGALSDAEQQLQVLKQSEALLGGIEENTKTSAQLMAELSAAQERTAAALANVPEDLASVYKMDELYAYIATLPQAIQSLPQALTDAINSVVPLGNAYLPSIPGLPGAGFVGPLPGPGYAATNIPALGEPDPAIVEIKGYTIEGNDLTRQLINEVTLLRNEVVSLKSEARDNTNALVSAEIKSGIVTGEVVANGVAGAVNAMAWQNNNVVTLR